MKIKCDYIKSIRPRCGSESFVIIDLCDVDYYHLYMTNEIEKILDEIPNEVIEKYIEDQRKIDE